MKILLISPTSSGIGGISQHVQGLTNFLENNSHKVEIISSENTFTIPIKGLKNPSFMISSFLKTKFKKHQDIVHAHNIPAALAMKNASGKKILSLHGVFSQQIDQLHGKITGNILKKYEQDALTWADAITVISKEAFDYYTSLGYKVFQVPNAIDISSLSKNENRKYENQLIFAGRLSKEKGIDILLDICNKLPLKFNLIILGSGPEEKRINKIANLKSNIHFIGYQSKEKTISLIRGSDILLQPSLIEGISSTILEAMACETIVIASDCGGNKELIENSKNGLLINSKLSDDYIQKIKEIFKDSEKKLSIGNEAKKSVQNYDWTVVGNQYLKIYDKILLEKNNHQKRIN